MSRLADLLDRYPGAIAADLAMAGWDVVDLFERGRYAFALAIVDHLPRTSAYMHALAEDDEYADQAVDHQAPRRHIPPMTEWTPETEALAAVFDRLGELVNAVAINHPSGKGKPHRVQPYPRPVTAFDRARARRLREAAEDLEARLFPPQR